ncbi:MAG TPA: OmpA family protein [Pyrinomonadaceae bacterium]|jgi:peptidoglycan-associated lipoprotein|nr:OmpA family protein [Pyrinomonadaceae bacterium]
MNDPSLPSDLALVNDELGRRRFTPDVYFDSGKDDLSDDARDKLAGNAELLNGQSQFNIIIEGHADSRGTGEDNLALGERRAAATKDYLHSLGVAAHRMRTVSYGDQRPVCTEETEDCWAQNRRAHMVITGRG